MSVADGLYILALVLIVVVLFALWHGDRVETRFRGYGVQLSLRYRRSRRK